MYENVSITSDFTESPWDSKFLGTIEPLPVNAENAQEKLSFIYGAVMKNKGRLDKHNALMDYILKVIKY